jgi:hypothetical protein
MVITPNAPSNKAGAGYPESQPSTIRKWILPEFIHILKKMTNFIEIFFNFMTTGPV